MKSKDPVDKAIEKPEADELIVVGIGASAGGVQALKEFFEHTPHGNNIAYVVILHLSPDHDSKLVEVVGHVTSLKVIQVKERVNVEKDHVYVVPPNQHLLMIDGALAVTPNIQVEDRRAPVDIFFRTLANSHGTRAVCVILSGTGANGSMGLKKIKELGGAAFVQNPREAEFNEMPRNAISTEMVDAVLPVSEIPGRIIAYKQSLSRVHITTSAEKRPDTQHNALREIFSLIRMRSGHDFSNYKRPTLLRRIERRINVSNLPDLNAYAAFLHQNHEETNLLLKDLLISVTNFFRDKKAFEAIETEVLPNLIRTKNSEQQIRIWVAGCATGEEAYSMAFLCAEHTMNVIDAPKVQIFATDIDEAAIAHAREGVYTINDAADVSPERLRRFFNKEGDAYRVKREIREMILFANHNFIKDPPFSHLDMVSCRNVVIYLNNTAQERVMQTFHFALEPGGYLFLGSSETADRGHDLYSTFNREQHIFQKRPVHVQRIYPVPESIPALRQEQNYKQNTPFEKLSGSRERVTFGELHQQLLEQYAPPSLVVNQEHDIVHLTEKAGRYLVLSGGEPSQNLLKLVRPELRLELRALLYQAAKLHNPVEGKGLKVRIGEETETINILVRPVLHSHDFVKGYMLVLFQQVESTPDDKSIVVTTNKESVAVQLEEELIRLKSQLRYSSEQHEFNAEELKASNEELHAMNEELRSATEELETSKEELQSINEELKTVNQELKVKVDETMLANNNLQNLINSVGIGTIFLDKSFRVAFFTPSARDIFNLIPSDYGRPLFDITTKLLIENLSADAELVLDKLQPIEREVRSSDGRFFVMRILPYRTAEDRINGVVITFIDITSRKTTEEALRASEERFRLLIEGAKDFAIFTIDTNRIVDTWNSGARTMMGYIDEEIMGRSGDIIFTPEDREKEHPMREVERALKQGVAENERWHLRKDGTRFYGSGTVRPLYDKNNKLLGFVKIMRDLTESKKAEHALAESEQRLRIALESAEMGVWDWDVIPDRLTWNKQHYLLLGLEPDDKPKNSAQFFQFVHDDDRELVNDALRNAAQVAGVFQVEFRVIRADKQVKYMSGYGRAVARNNLGQATRIVGVMYDITNKKELERQKDEFIAVASHELKTPVTSIKGYTEILADRFTRTGEAENGVLMQKLNSQVDRLARLIRDLLDTSKIAEGKLELKESQFDINNLVQAYIDLLPPTLKKHTIDFHPKDKLVVKADKDRIEQVLTNLISNAIKYSPAGGKIAITSEKTEKHVKVSVTDNGIGLSEEDKDRVFNRFFRATEKTTSGLQGMGLGLYISAGIIKRHGGMIDVISRPGSGSTFFFTLPLA